MDKGVRNGCMMASDQIESILSYPSIPTLPTVAVKLLELTRDPDVSLKEIEKLVLRDQGLASRVLRTINSSFYGLASPCTTIKRALGLLGLNSVKSLVLGFSLVDLTKNIDGSAMFDYVAYWQRSIYSAIAARQIALVTSSCDSEEAFTCGMFQDLGMLITFLVLQDEYAEVLAAAGSNHEKLADIENEMLGFDHAQIGAALAEKWKMPPLMIECIRHHHALDSIDQEHRNLVQVVALGRSAYEALGNDMPEQHMADLLCLSQKWFGQGCQDIGVLLESIAVSAADLATTLGQDIGELPDIQAMLNKANEQMTMFTLEAQQQVEHLRQIESDLNQQVDTDGLTGIGNRKKFDRMFKMQFEHCRTGSKPLSVLIVDADHFKLVNDNHGHQAGDAVLVGLAQRISDSVRDTDTACRYGGEEFAIIVPNMNAGVAEKLAGRILKSISDVPFDMSGVEGVAEKLSLTVSIGIAALDPTDPDRFESPTQLLAEADRALYEAKDAGRNCVKVFNPNLKADSPIEEAASASEEVSPPTPAPDSGETPHIILVVDDALAAVLLHTLFRKLPGVRLSLLRNMTEALAWLQKTNIDSANDRLLILCDLRSPDEQGIEFVRNLRQNCDLLNTPVVMVTASDDPEVKQDYLAAGADVVYHRLQITSSLSEWRQSVFGLLSRSPAPAV